MKARRIALIGITALLAASGTAMAGIALFVVLPRASAPLLPVRSSGAVLWVADTAVLTEMATQFLQSEQRQALDAVVRTWGRTTLGPDVSVRYDVLPLLNEALLIWDDATGDWTLRSVIDGGAEAFLDRLHASYRAGIPNVVRTQRLLDDRFPLNMVEIDDQTVTDDSTQENGWTVRIQRSLTGSGTLASARRGREIILGANPAAVRALLQKTITPPAPWRGILAIGSLPRKLLASETATLFLPATLQGTIGAGSGDTILWSLRRQNDTLTVTTH